MVDLVTCGIALAVAWRGDGSAALPLAPEDLFARTYVRELALAPDGARALVFEVAGGSAATASLVELRFAADGAIERSAHPLPDDAWGHVAWDRSGAKVAFLRAAPPRTELWTLAADGTPQSVLPAGVAATIFELFWRTHDGEPELLAMHNAVSGMREAVLSKVDLERGELGEEIARFGTLTIKEAALAHDGQTLALVATETPNYAPEGEPLDLYLADLGDHALAKLTHGDAIVARPSFSPDSSRVACTLLRASTLLSTAKRDVVLFDVASGRERLLTGGLDLSIGDGVNGAGDAVAFLDERTLLVATQHGLADHVLALELPGREEGDGPVRQRFVVEGELSWQKLQVAAAAHRVIALESGPAQPERVVAAEWPSMRPRPIEAPNDDLAARLPGSASIVPFTGAQRWPMEGLLIVPRGPPPFPTILLLHGGSSGRATLRFNDGYAQGYAALGYAVFAPNLRGSAGYGVAFNRANEGDFGGAELDDLDAALEELVARGIADPARLFLLGHSYGGFLVEMALVRSRSFAAGCAAAGVSDWQAFVESSDLAALAYIGLGGGPDARRELYEARSPLLHAAEIRTPLLLVHGDRDRRVPIAQSERLDAALRRAGTPSELLRLSAVGHVFRGAEVGGRWIRAADAWFRAHSPGGATK